MRVLHINHFGFTRGGGSGAAMQRLHLGIRASGMDSKVLCWDEPNKIPDLFRLNISSRRRKLDSLIGRLTARLGLNDINLVSSFRVKKHQGFLDADILNFHILNGCFSYLAMPYLTKDKPAVWTLHDMWSFTGHCYYSLDCSRWKTGCGQCPYPNTFPKIRKDNTHIEWKLKRWAYNRSNLTIVTPSTWLTELAKQSMLKNFPIYNIPYGVDTDAYRSLDRDQCRSLLGISPSKNVLMFCSDHVGNPIKGLNLLREALRALPASLKTECVLLLLGHGGETVASDLNIPAIYLGYVPSDRLKAICYSASDLFIHPTRADNLPLVLQESMACGTPMVSFRLGGVPDLVRPGVTGYLADPENPQDMMSGIVQLLEDKALRNRMSQECRAIALKEYGLELYAKRYVDVYRKVLQQN